MTATAVPSCRDGDFVLPGPVRWAGPVRVRDGMDMLEVGCGGGLLCQRIKSLLPVGPESTPEHWLPTAAPVSPHMPCGPRRSRRRYSGRGSPGSASTPSR